MINWVGAILIVASSSALGYLAARCFSERCNLLKIWLWVVEILKTEIGFQALLLPEVFHKVAGMMSDPEVKAVFHQLSVAMEYGAAQAFTEAWKECIGQSIWKPLKQSEMEVLRELGWFLGSTDRQDQLAKLTFCKTRLEHQLQQAEAEQRKQMGLYRYLGFAAGAMLVLWLG